MPLEAKGSSSCIISPCGLYRYTLTRSWGNGPTLLFVMLNPSTADALTDDPTVRKCVGFAKRLGYQAIEIVNCYAFRTPKPAELYAAMRRHVYVVGTENDEHIDKAIRRADRIVAAWGANKIFSRPTTISTMAKCAGKALEALAITPSSGAPQHPLMARYVDTLVPFEVRP
jgi:hypothetical protein